MLYVDLANPTPNGIYRRIGYEARPQRGQAGALLFIYAITKPTG
jgi:hypothetical protein